ncbi:MAG: hypothetical protein M1815_005987 [Lichina confinis]|nr:MAG: hypothetical protein M1815_005987 [Lichina confinis]
MISRSLPAPPLPRKTSLSSQPLGYVPPSEAGQQLRLEHVERDSEDDDGEEEEEEEADYDEEQEEEESSFVAARSSHWKGNPFLAQAQLGFPTSKTL